jgi:hypothetical protein
MRRICSGGESLWVPVAQKDPRYLGELMTRSIGASCVRQFRTTTAAELLDVCYEIFAQDKQGSIVVIWRVNDDSDGLVDQVFGSAMEDPGRLCADLPGRDRVAIARRVLTFLDGDGFGSSGALIQYLSEALGSEGRAEVRETTGEIGRL